MDEKSKMAEWCGLLLMAIEVKEESKLTFFSCSDDRRRDESLRRRLVRRQYGVQAAGWRSGQSCDSASECFSGTVRSISESRL
jgi:hypothetical protein